MRETTDLWDPATETTADVDLAAARTTGARLRWERMSRPSAGAVPLPRRSAESGVGAEVEVGPEAARLAEQHLD